MFTVFLDDGLLMFAHRGNNENQTRKIDSFLHWVMSSASSPKKKHDLQILQMVSWNLSLIFSKKSGIRGSAKHQWDVWEQQYTEEGR